MAGRIKVLSVEGMEMAMDSAGVATVYMVNGENRFRVSFIQAWNKILDEVESNSAINGLIITGTDKYFSLGLDLDYFASQTEDYIDRVREGSAQLYQRIKLLPIPTVAAINGHAYGAGAFLAIVCDYLVMRADRGWLCFPETALGMQLKETSQRWIRLKAGAGNTLRDAIIFSKRLTASEAHAQHLVDIIESSDKLLPAAVELIKGCLGKHGIDRVALGEAKKDVYDVKSWQHDSKL